MDNVLKTATGIMFVTMAGVCFLGGMVVLKTPAKRDSVQM